MIQLQKSCTIIDPRDVGQLKLQFRERQCVLLPKLLEPALLEFLLPRFAQPHWRDLIHEGFGVEDVFDDHLALGVLHFVANTSALLDAVREISGCEGINKFFGRVYRMIPNSRHYDSWHSDNSDNRRVGMSINLSSLTYTGGVFQLRDHHSKRVFMEIANTGLGDATLFRISPALEHQVTTVTGDEPKTAFAGWFRSGRESLLTSIRRTPPSP